jgi:hypothetical protein
MTNFGIRLMATPDGQPPGRGRSYRQALASLHNT